MTAGTKPLRRLLPSLDELRRRGWRVLPPSGKGYIMPVGRKPVADPPREPPPPPTDRPPKP
jgi:hypothetical protein